MRTFETLPRVEPGLGTGSAGGRGRGVGSAPGKASTLATLPKSRAAGRSRHWAPGGRGSALRRAGAGGRAAPRREKRRPEGPRPGRLGERAEAAAAQASRWVRVSGQSGSSRCGRRTGGPYPSLAAPSGGRAALAAGAGPGPLNFSRTQGVGSGRVTRGARLE